MHTLTCALKDSQMAKAHSALVLNGKESRETKTIVLCGGNYTQMQYSIN